MNRFPGIRAICFDVGGTLIDPWPSVGHVYAAVAQETGLAAADPETLNRRFEEAWRAKKRFDYTREDWAELVARTFEGDPAEVAITSAFFGKLYDRFTEATAWQVYPDVLPALNVLKNRGFMLAVISNWDDRLRQVLRNLNLDSWFDAIEVSGETGLHKPCPDIFRRAITAMGVTAEQTLHVGDSLLEDYQGAQNAGLKAVLIRRSNPVASMEQILSLGELLELLPEA